MGYFFSTARDGIARGLIRIGVRPNWLTTLGAVLTFAAGVCYALGIPKKLGWSLDPTAPANAYIPLAGLMLYWASACDMLDGAVARLGGRCSRYGAFFDSSIDRLSDFCIYGGIAMGFALSEPANATFLLLSLVAMFNSFMISYSKARAENMIESCPVGYWQRGERSAAVVIATFSCNMPALLVQQAISPIFTVIRRIRHTKGVLSGKSPITDPRQGGFWTKIQLWRWRRMTWQYDVITLANIAWLVFARFESVDVLRQLLGGT